MEFLREGRLHPSPPHSTRPGTVTAMQIVVPASAGRITLNVRARRHRDRRGYLHPNQQLARETRRRLACVSIDGFLRSKLDGTPSCQQVRTRGALSSMDQ